MSAAVFHNIHVGDLTKDILLHNLHVNDPTDASRQHSAIVVRDLLMIDDNDEDDDWSDLDDDNSPRSSGNRTLDGPRSPASTQYDDVACASACLPPVPDLLSESPCCVAQFAFDESLGCFSGDRHAPPKKKVSELANPIVEVHVNKDGKQTQKENNGSEAMMRDEDELGYDSDDDWGQFATLSLD